MITIIIIIIILPSGLKWVMRVTRGRRPFSLLAIQRLGSPLANSRLWRHRDGIAQIARHDAAMSHIHLSRTVTLPSIARSRPQNDRWRVQHQSRRGPFLSAARGT